MTAFEITMRHGDAPPDLHRFVEEKISKLDKFLKPASRLEVVLDRVHENFTCEVILHSSRRGGQVVVSDRHTDVHACVDQTLEKLSRQLQKQKDRRVERHRAGWRGDEVPRAGRDDGIGPEEPTYEDIVNRQVRGE